MNKITFKGYSEIAKTAGKVAPFLSRMAILPKDQTKIQMGALKRKLMPKKLRLSSNQGGSRAF